MSSTTSQSFSYSIFSFVTDEIRDASVPVGIALWSSNPKQVRIRFASAGEKIKGLGETAYTYLRVAEQQVNQWLSSGKVPYATGHASPYSDAWWKHLSGMMVHSVRLSDPRPIDGGNVDNEADLLFEAVVAPERISQERTERVDSVLSSALGRSLTKRLQRGTVTGFAGRPVPVKHFKSHRDSVIVVEAVNLAVAAAENDADALVSRLQRIRAANGPTGGKLALQAIVGYLASPHGLNGEAALVAWIEKSGGAKTFDLLREHDKLHDVVESLLEALEQS
jgi:hypothetical protein